MPGQPAPPPPRMAVVPVVPGAVRWIESLDGAHALLIVEHSGSIELLLQQGKNILFSVSGCKAEDCITSLASLGGEELSFPPVLPNVILKKGGDGFFGQIPEGYEMQGCTAIGIGTNRIKRLRALSLSLVLAAGCASPEIGSDIAQAEEAYPGIVAACNAAVESFPLGQSAGTAALGLENFAPAPEAAPETTTTAAPEAAPETRRRRRSVPMPWKQTWTGYSDSDAESAPTPKPPLRPAPPRYPPPSAALKRAKPTLRLTLAQPAKLPPKSAPPSIVKYLPSFKNKSTEAEEEHGLASHGMEPATARSEAKATSSS